MAFSIFKKDPKASRAPDHGTAAEGRRTLFGNTLFGKRAALDPKGRTLGGPAGRGSGVEHAPPRKETVRALARQTAEKIDRIESEMARSLTLGAAPPTRMGPATQARSGVPTRPDEFAGVSTDAFLGQAQAIEITQPGETPALDDAAIAFANGDEGEAADLLRAAVADKSLGEMERTAWRMLLELEMLRDDRVEFESLAQRYAQRFGAPAPAWRVYASAAPAPVAMPAPPPPSVDEGPLVRLPSDLNAEVVDSLRVLKAKAAQYRDLAVDASAARSIDAEGAELLLRLLAGFRGKAYRLTVFGIERLLSVLRRAAVPGRRDESDAIWILLLEAVRLTGNQAVFEDVAMQYCVTYEVSPPAWEPSAPNIALGQVPPPLPAAAPPPSPPPAVTAADDRLRWRGEVLGNGGAAFEALLARAQGQKALVVECAELRRMGYDTAAILLGHVMKLQAHGTAVVLRDVNPWVAALLNLTGVTAVAEVQGRPD